MPEIRPFRGIRFGLPDGDMARVIAPPYDVISPSLQRTLYERDPRNIVRCVLNATPGDGAYADAARHFRGLLTDRVLVEDGTASHYLLEQLFALDEGPPRSRWGLLTRFRAEDPEGGRILPHEKTRKEPREDRYKLLEATRANFSPIFLMCEDAGGFAELVLRSRKDAVAAATDDEGVRHRLFRIADPGDQAAFSDLIGRGRAFIADGHHRYATALRYRDAHGPEGAWTFGYFTPLSGEGLAVLPYHRVVQGVTAEEIRTRLDGPFRLSASASLGDLARAVARSKAPFAFGFGDARAATLAESQPAFLASLPAGAHPSLRALDTFALHQGVLQGLLGRGEKGVEFRHSLEDVAATVQAGNAVGILLRPTTVQQIVDVSLAGESMPPKSTFFFPKIPSGLLIHPLPG